MQGDEGPHLRQGGDAVGDPAGSRMGRWACHGRSMCAWEIKNTSFTFSFFFQSWVLATGAKRGSFLYLYQSSGKEAIMKDEQSNEERPSGGFVYS